MLKANHQQFRGGRGRYLRQGGFTIVEVMVSLTIGLVLLGGVLAIFGISRSSFNISESEARMLDNARFALHLIETDLRAAGSFGRNNWPSGIEGRRGSAGHRQ